MARRFAELEDIEQLSTQEPDWTLAEHHASVSLVSGASMRPEAIAWLWNGYLARGKLHLIAGKPSAGKTTVALDLASTVTRGGKFPDGAQAGPGNVLIWSGEDGIADTLVPRLAAAGADMSRVFFVGERQEGAEKRSFDPASDMPLLVEAARTAGGVAVMLLDPLVSAVAGDSHKNAEVRRGLQPVVEFAVATGAVVIGITHLSKGTGGQDPVDRITGSLAFGAVTRLAFLVAREDAEEGSPGRRVITRAKSNIGPDGGGFYYDIQSTTLVDNPSVVTSKVHWMGTAEGSARDIIGAAETSHNEEARSALDEAVDFLLIELHDGPVPAKTAKRNALDAGITAKTLRRAADKAGVLKEKAGFEQGWVWKLPGQPKMPTSIEDAQDDHTPGVGHLRNPWAPSQLPSNCDPITEVDL